MKVEERIINYSLKCCYVKSSYLFAQLTIWDLTNKVDIRNYYKKYLIELHENKYIIGRLVSIRK